jgi:signal transduction histidine kinase
MADTPSQPSAEPAQDEPTAPSGPRADRGFDQRRTARSEPADAVPLFPEMARLELDVLLTQLVERAEEVMATQERMRGLLQATRSVASELSLPVLLRQIVQAAQRLVGARYAALGVLADDRSLAQFVHVGFDGQTVATVGALPQGRGILGLLIEDPQVLRLDDLGAHPRSAGFPSGHPPMASFLGAPIRIHDRVFGNLYLTEKAGGGSFTRDDEELVGALAAAAAVAIDNARLLDDAHRRQHWSQASAEISTRLLAGVETAEALALVARQARLVSGADIVTVAMPVPGRDEMRVEVADGHDAERWRGGVFPLAGSVAEVALRDRRPVLVDDLASDEHAVASAGRSPELGAAILAPVAEGDRVVGILGAVRLRGRDGFDALDLEMVAGFAIHAAVALRLARARTDRELLHLMEDHERIARDLHDQVIQRLFATGLGLQSLAARLGAGTEHAERLYGFGDELDNTIRDIRTTIYGLHQRRSASGLRSAVLDITGEATRALGFTPQLRLDGLLDTLVPPDVAEQALAVLREALSNVARHGHASQVLVEVTLDPTGMFTVRVVDDGVGLGAVTRRSGLSNLRERAERLGGTLTLESGPTSDSDRGAPGLSLEWRVPARPQD